MRCSAGRRPARESMSRVASEVRATLSSALQPNPPRPSKRPMFRCSVFAAAALLLTACSPGARPSQLSPMPPAAQVTQPAVPTPEPMVTSDPCAADPASVESGLVVTGVDGVVHLDLEPDAPGPSAPIDPF